jgi:glycogen operon protein
MLLGGDEFRRTQRGNNNAYCQDNEISWYNWTYLEKHREIARFTRKMIAFRKAHSILRKPAFYTNGEIRWFDSAGEAPDWNQTGANHLGCIIRAEEGEDLCMLFNAEDEAVTFNLPQSFDGGVWHIAADTAASSPADIVEPGEERSLEHASTYELTSRSGAILVALM